MFSLNKKNLSCMSLHAISVIDKVYKWSPEKKCTSKAPLKVLFNNVFTLKNLSYMYTCP